MRNHNLGNQSGEKGEMQDKYVGDIGDFGKYGLLRALFGKPEEPGSGCGLSLAVAWYLNEDKKPGGQKTDYPALRECDPFLYDSLQSLIKNNKRKVSAVENSNILPCDTRFNHRELICSSMRTKWFKGALNATEGADVVFVIPDNGIASPRTPLGSSKHVLPYELDCFFKRGQSLVIYHHLAYLEAGPQIEGTSRRLREDLDLLHHPWALRCHRGSSRVYFIVPRDEHRTELGNRLKIFEDSPWVKQGHFELVTSPCG